MGKVCRCRWPLALRRQEGQSLCIHVLTPHGYFYFDPLALGTIACHAPGKKEASNRGSGILQAKFIAITSQKPFIAPGLSPEFCILIRRSCSSNSPPRNVLFFGSNPYYCTKFHG